MVGDIGKELNERERRRRLRGYEEAWSWGWLEIGKMEDEVVESESE